MLSLSQNTSLSRTHRQRRQAGSMERESTVHSVVTVPGAVGSPPVALHHHSNCTTTLTLQMKKWEAQGGDAHLGLHRAWPTVLIHLG